MAGPLLNNDRLFQTLLTEALPDIDVAADLDANTIESIPAVMHSSSVSQTVNADGLWEAILTVHLFAEARGAFDLAAYVYATIHSWGDLPLNGIVEGVGAVETVADMNAISRRSGEISMDNKQVVQYDGSFNLLIRKL